MQAAMKIMEISFAEEIYWTRPAGGYTIWVKSLKRLSEKQLYQTMLRYGVIVSPGNYYFPHKKTSEYLCISIARKNEEEIKEGILRLGKALHRITQGNQ